MTNRVSLQSQNFKHQPKHRFLVEIWVPKGALALKAKIKEGISKIRGKLTECLSGKPRNHESKLVLEKQLKQFYGECGNLNIIT